MSFLDINADWIVMSPSSSSSSSLPSSSNPRHYTKKKNIQTTLTSLPLTPSSSSSNNTNQNKKPKIEEINTSLIPPTKNLITSLDHWYWLQKPVICKMTGEIDNESWKIVVTPVVNSKFSNEEAEPYPLYEETLTHVGIPRFLGLERYGEPNVDQLNEGEPMNPDLKFTWELQNTPQKPQQDAVNAWLNNGCRGVIKLGCGTGKTVIAIKIAWLKKRRTLFLIHNEGLLYQVMDRIKAIIPEAKIGVLRQKKREIEGMDFVIGMIQSFKNVDPKELDSFGMLIVDECHHIAAKTFCRAVLKTKCKYVLGLSATPERKDGLSHVIHWLLGPVVFSAERRDITPQKIYQVEYKDGNQKLIQYKNGILGIPTMVTRMTLDAKRNQLVDTCLKKLFYKNGITKIIVLSARRDHLKQMYENHKTNYDCGLYIGQLKKNDLESAKERQVIFATFSMANEFLDIAGLNGMILATPASGNLEQIIGRLREKMGVYDTCKSTEEDVNYEEEIEFVLKQLNMTNKIIDSIKEYLKASTDRVVIDIVDPFDVFDGMAWKRFHGYKKLDYIVKRMNQTDFENIEKL